MIAFLELPRDQRWESYGDDITALLQDATNTNCDLIDPNVA